MPGTQRVPALTADHLAPLSADKAVSVSIRATRPTLPFSRFEIAVVQRLPTVEAPEASNLAAPATQGLPHLVAVDASRSRVRAPLEDAHDSEPPGSCHSSGISPRASY